ncbi:hypothetical protein BGW37DRAFT_524031 [Umbelopsis sp. PMI_123]|nr:hypothetical protein BGW37DRAFT_524031 [Umbelopsis sp. PMI_123]
MSKTNSIYNSNLSSIIWLDVNMSLALTIPQREIGKTGVKASAVGLGCMSLCRRTISRFQGENFKKNLELTDSIRLIAEKRGVTAAQVTLAWLLAQGEKYLLFLELAKKKYLLDNAAGGSLQLSKEELD